MYEVHPVKHLSAESAGDAVRLVLEPDRPSSPVLRRRDLHTSALTLKELEADPAETSGRRRAKDAWGSLLGNNARSHLENMRDEEIRLVDPIGALANLPIESFPILVDRRPTYLGTETGVVCVRTPAVAERVEVEEPTSRRISIGFVIADGSDDEAGNELAADHAAWISARAGSPEYSEVVFGEPFRWNGGGWVDALSQSNFDVVVVSCHGVAHPDGAFLAERAHNPLHKVFASDAAKAFSDCGARVVLLRACDSSSSTAGGAPGFAGVVAGLGIDAVIAFRRAVNIGETIAPTRTVLEELLAGSSVGEAVQKARIVPERIRTALTLTMAPGVSALEFRLVTKASEEGRQAFSVIIHGSTNNTVIAETVNINMGTSSATFGALNQLRELGTAKFGTKDRAPRPLTTAQFLDELANNEHNGRINLGLRDELIGRWLDSDNTTSEIATFFLETSSPHIRVEDVLRLFTKRGSEQTSDLVVLLVKSGAIHQADLVYVLNDARIAADQIRVLVNLITEMG